jgi:hypothetical protein
MSDRAIPRELARVRGEDALGGNNVTVPAPTHNTALGGSSPAKADDMAAKLGLFPRRSLDGRAFSRPLLDQRRRRSYDVTTPGGVDVAQLKRSLSRGGSLGGNSRGASDSGTGTSPTTTGKNSPRRSFEGAAAGPAGALDMQRKSHSATGHATLDRDRRAALRTLEGGNQGSSDDDDGDNARDNTG